MSKHSGNIENEIGLEEFIVSKDGSLLSQIELADGNRTNTKLMAYMEDDANSTWYVYDEENDTEYNDVKPAEMLEIVSEKYNDMINRDMDALLYYW